MRVKIWIKKPAVTDVSLETKMSFEYVCRDDTFQKKDIDATAKPSSPALLVL